MPTIDKKAICDALVTAMQKEELHTREAAKYLNLNPRHLSMAQNPNSWDSMGKSPWIRLQKWFENREPLSEFSIPEGEEIWKPEEKTTAVETKSEAKKIHKAYKKVMEVHDAVVIERNRMDQPSFEKMLKKVAAVKPADRDYAIPTSEPMRIPITLDLKINIEVQLFGKTINTTL